jgi:hypothetical protein
MDRLSTHRSLVAAAVALVLFSCVSAAAATSGTVTYGCSPVNHNDTSAWLSVSRGLFRDSVYQYWLSQSYAYLTHVQYSPPLFVFVLFAFVTRPFLCLGACAVWARACAVGRVRSGACCVV